MTRTVRTIGLLLVAILSGCSSVPDIDYGELPYFTYSPMSESGVTDRRSEFAQIFCDQLRSGIEPEYAERDCRDFLHMENEPAVSTVPAETDLLMVGGRASSAHNAELIAEWLEAEERQSGPPIVLVGYSKGIPDILEAIVRHPEAMGQVTAVVGVAGVVNGSPIASDQSGFMESFIENLPMSDCDGGNGDGSAIESLSYEYRQRWLQQHPIQTHIRFFSVVPFGNIDQMSTVMKSSYRKLRHMDPRNDGQVIYRDAILPDSELLAYVRADHLAVALPIEGGLAGIIVDKNEYPRGALLTSIVIAVQRWL